MDGPLPSSLPLSFLYNMSSVPPSPLPSSLPLSFLCPPSLPHLYPPRSLLLPMSSVPPSPLPSSLPLSFLCPPSLPLSYIPFSLPLSYSPLPSAPQFDVRRPATISGICRGGSREAMYAPGQHTFGLVASSCVSFPTDSAVLTGKIVSSECTKFERVEDVYMLVLWC